MKRAFKILMWVVLGPLAALLLLALAWIAVNGRWADAAPQPVPPELQPQAMTLAPADNAFFDSQGLRAPEGESVNAWGQRAWRGETPADAKLLGLPSGDDWQCQAHKADCMARWRGAAAVLTAQMSGLRTFGERCKALATRTGFQEPLPVRPTNAKPGQEVPLPQFAPVTNCLRWLHIEAVLAPDVPRAQAAFAQADALLRLLAAGSQTLVGQAITWVAVTRHQQLLAQWSAGQPAGVALPAAWLAPMPPRLLQPRHWMAAEVHWRRETVAAVIRGGEQLYSTAPNALQAWAGRHNVGYLPELTMQVVVTHWMDDVRLFGHLQGPALAAGVRSRPEPDMSWWRYLRWRNSLGHFFGEMARPQPQTYALRQADLVLYQAALEASQQLNDVPAAVRAAWWARQPLDAGVRERLSLDGGALLVRTWRGETDAAHAAPVRFPLRPA